MVVVVGGQCGGAAREGEREIKWREGERDDEGE